MPCSRGSSRVVYAASSGLGGHRRALVTGELGVIHDSCRSGSDSVGFKGFTDWGLIVESPYWARRHRRDPRPMFP